MRKKYRLTESRLRGIIRESVKSALYEHEHQYKYFVADEGDGTFMPFPYDYFDEDGYYLEHEGEDGYHISDFDIVYETNDWDDACEWAEDAERYEREGGYTEFLKSWPND